MNKFNLFDTGREESFIWAPEVFGDQDTKKAN
jgi:hypothetical protein